MKRIRRPLAFTVAAMIVLISAGWILDFYGLPLLRTEIPRCSYGHVGGFGCASDFGYFGVAWLIWLVGGLWSAWKRFGTW